MASSILLVDGETHIRRILAYVLRCEGFVIHTAGDSQAARAVLDTHPVDLVLMDINLPDPETGFELATSLANRRTGEDLPVIILTGESSPETVKRSHGLAAAGFITKPFSIRFVLRRIRAILPETGESSPDAHRR